MKSIKKISALLLTLALALSLCSCSKGEDVISCNGASITDRMFSYTLSFYKSQYLYYYLNSSGSSSAEMKDVPELWSQTTASSEGKTLGEVLKQNVIDNEKTVVYFASRAKEMGISLTDSEIETVKSNIQKMRENFDDDKAFEEYMATFNVTPEELEELTLQEALAQKVQQKLFSAGGLFEITSSDILDYYEQNYVSVKHIYINNINYTAENGKTVVLNDQQKAEKNAKADAVMKNLENGESFESQMSESEDDIFESVGDKYTITKGDIPVPEYETAAFDMKEGEVRRLDTSSGIVIIKKYSLDNITDSITAAIQNTIISERTTQLVDDYDSKFEINQQLLDSFNVVDMPVFSD